MKIATLNAPRFAGHTDWRLPNRRELESLVDAGPAPAVYRPGLRHGLHKRMYRHDVQLHALERPLVVHDLQ